MLTLIFKTNWGKKGRRVRERKKGEKKKLPKLKTPIRQDENVPYGYIHSNGNGKTGGVSPI